MDVIGTKVCRVFLLAIHIHLDRVHTEWQWPLSGAHSIMIEKLAQAGEVGGYTPTPFHYIYHHVKSCSVRSSWEGRYTSPISSVPLCPLWSPLLTYFTPHPPSSKSGFKLVCNVNIVYGNLKSENSQDYAQKPQRNCTFMNLASALHALQKVGSNTGRKKWKAIKNYFLFLNLENRRIICLRTGISALLYSK